MLKIINRFAFDFLLIRKMIEIGNTIVSNEVLTQKFMCDLTHCKGACCVEGDSGAPLEKEELNIIETVVHKVKPYMTKEGIKAIEKYGAHTIDKEGDNVTPLINGQECAYTYFENGIARCSFEAAFMQGDTPFKKPISCHLYPVRIKKYTSFEAVNYNDWEICIPAKKLGENEGIILYQMLKEALIRKYGKKWYEELEIAAKHISQKKST